MIERDHSEVDDAKDDHDRPEDDRFGPLAIEEKGRHEDEEEDRERILGHTDPIDQVLDAVEGGDFHGGLREVDHCVGQRMDHDLFSSLRKDVGLNIFLTTPCGRAGDLHRPADSAILSDAPEVDGNEDGDGQRNSDAMEDVEAQERRFADRRSGQ